MPAELTLLLKELSENFDRSKTAYQDYLAGGKTFHYACELKKYNSRIMELLSSKKELLPDELQKDAAALLMHYTAWTNKWEQLAADSKPGPDDIFVFENEVTFPREAAGRIISYEL